MDRKLAFIRYLKRRNIDSRITYLRWTKLLERSQWLSQEEIINYQWSRVKLILDHAYSTIPYYKELFINMGATPNDIRTWDDFRRIPYMTKDIVRERTNDLISRKVNPSQLRYYTTGGSTGEPLGFYKIAGDEAIERAFMFFQWRRVGYSTKSSRIILRGEPLNDNKIFQRYRFTNDWLLSSYHLTMDNIPQYVSFLNRIKPDYFHVYPSSLYIFTQLLTESKFKLGFVPKAILCGSEPVYDFQRRLFEEVYKTRLYSWLGQAEGAVMAGECESSNNYHAWPFYSYVELINENGELISESGCNGEIIGTTLNNFTFPFIRYRTGDIATFYGYRCDKCSRNATIIGEIQGRVQDTIILSDGTHFPIGPAIFGIHDKKWTMINKIQIVQETKGEIVVKVDTFHNEQEVLMFLKGILEKRIGHICKFEIKFSKDIERTEHGKHRLLVQKIVE